jgi:predicted transcriptional regulator
MAIYRTVSTRPAVVGATARETAQKLRKSLMTDALKNDPLLPMVTEIVVAYLSHNTVAMTDIPRLIAETRAALAQTAGVNGSAERSHFLTATKDPAVPIKKSVTPDFLICLEDGTKLKMLKRHLRTTYDMTPEQYRQKWGLPDDYPMVAPNYAKKRSSLAREFGLGRGGAKTRTKRRG